MVGLPRIQLGRIFGDLGCCVLHFFADALEVVVSCSCIKDSIKGFDIVKLRQVLNLDCSNLHRLAFCFIVFVTGGRGLKFHAIYFSLAER